MRATSLALSNSTQLPLNVQQTDSGIRTELGELLVASDALLDTPIRSAGGVTGPVALVLRTVAVGHVLGHYRDIRGEPSSTYR